MIPRMANRHARDMRRNMTDAERRLWSALRDRRLAGYKFRRQYPVGPFILDFACIEHLVAIEADGGQHTERARDQDRTRMLETEGWRVLRFWNKDVLANTDGVLETIIRELQMRAREPPSPSQP